MTRRVALVGMYGGYFGERNPGCFLILEATLRALALRLPNTSFDIYSEDAIARFQGVRKEVVHGRELHFFSPHWGTTLLETTLVSYDALVMGGDVILAPPPPPSVFLLESAAFRAATRPPVFYNAAHTALSANEIRSGFHAERLRCLCDRSSYVGVRTEYVRDALVALGYADRVGFCPDPTLALDAEALSRTDAASLPRGGKKILGVSVMAHLADPIAEAISTDVALLEEHDVWIYPYSRQYNHIETVLRLKQKYGHAFNYIDRYRDPLDTFALMSEFDASINDTYHGMIAALLSGIPFLAIDREDSARSRKQNLLRLLSLEDRIATSSLQGLTDEAGELLRGEALVRRWHTILRRLREAPRADLGPARALINAHFDRIAEGIAAPPVRQAAPLDG